MFSEDSFLFEVTEHILAGILCALFIWRETERRKEYSKRFLWSPRIAESMALEKYGTLEKFWNKYVSRQHIVLITFLCCPALTAVIM